MKALIKCFVFCTLIWNTGAIRGCYNFVQSQEKCEETISHELKMRLNILQEAFWKNRLDEVKNKPKGYYTVEMYFTDMVAMREIWCEETGTEEILPSIFTEQLELQRITYDSNPSQERIDQARLLYLPDYNSHSAPIDWFSFLRVLLLWILKQYILGIPLTFVLFWLWRSDYGRFSEYSTTNARFIISLIVWPVVFIQLFHREAREGLQFGLLDICADKVHTKIVTKLAEIQNQISLCITQAIACYDCCKFENIFHYSGRLDQVILGPPEPIPWYGH